jgi:hypothetical protein
MKRKEDEQKTITVYWWNLGTKTLDYTGNYKGYLDKLGIKVSSVVHPFAKTKGFRFVVSTSSSIVRLDSFSNSYKQGCDDAIGIYLILMGDKSLFRDGYGRERKFNWR